MKYTVIYPEAYVTRQLYGGPIRIVNNAFERDVVGAEELCYEVAICHATLGGLARRAATNLKQTAFNGPLRVRILRARELTSQESCGGRAK